MEVHGNVSVEEFGGVRNQFLIRTNDAVYLQSYNSIIARREFAGGQVTLDTRYWDYSKTTGKYRNLFLRETLADTRRKIADGTYKLADLNP